MPHRRIIPLVYRLAPLSAAAALLVSTGLGGCKDFPAESATSPAQAAAPAGNVVHFKVEGLHCHGCAASARNRISHVEGVQRCNVSFEGGSAEVVLGDGDDEDAVVATIIEAVTGLGFTIERGDS